MNTWKIGYAERDITPTPGQGMMSGYGTERHATRARAPLRAQALVLQPVGGTPAVLLTADLLGFDRQTVELVRRTLNRTHGIPPEAVLLSASHTHWGAGASYRINFCVGGLDIWYRKRVEEALLAAANEALKRPAAGSVGYTALDARIGCNRRLSDAKGHILMAPNPAGAYDSHTPVLRILRSETPSELWLIGHACHPTGSGPLQQWWPEYPGAMRARIERALGPGGRALFVMGCGADGKLCYTPPGGGPPVFAADPVRSAAAGRRLADAAMRHVARNGVQSLDGPLSCRIASGDLTFAARRTRKQLEALAYDGSAGFCEVSWARQSLAYPDARRALHYEVQTWRFGNALTLIGLEGEVCNELGALARGLARTPEAMAVGYVNATEGYIPTRRIVAEGGYEGESSHRVYSLPAPFSLNVEREFSAIVRRAVR
jgi:hypothetical protein